MPASPVPYIPPCIPKGLSCSAAPAADTRHLAPGPALQIVQHFTELDLRISSARVSSDGGWFVDGEHPPRRAAARRVPPPALHTSGGPPVGARTVHPHRALPWPLALPLLQCSTSARPMGRRCATPRSCRASSRWVLPWAGRGGRAGPLLRCCRTHRHPACTLFGQLADLSACVSPPHAAPQMLNVYMQQQEDLVLNGGAGRELPAGVAAAAAGWRSGRRCCCCCCCCGLRRCCRPRPACRSCRRHPPPACPSLKVPSAEPCLADCAPSCVLLLQTTPTT